MLLCYFCSLEWMSIYFMFLMYSQGSSIKQLKEKEKEKKKAAVKRKRKKAVFLVIKIMHILGEILESTTEKIF